MYLSNDKEVEEQGCPHFLGLSCVAANHQSSRGVVSYQQVHVSVPTVSLLTDLFCNPLWDACCVAMGGLQTMVT